MKARYVTLELASHAARPSRSIQATPQADAARSTRHVHGDALTMRIEFLRPHPALRPYVVRYLALATDTVAAIDQHIGPAGGPALVVITRGTQMGAATRDALEKTPPAYLCGHLDRALLTVFAERCRSFIVHFTATGAYPLLGLSVRDLTNQVVEIAAVGGTDLQSWAAALAEAPNDAARAVATDRVLLARHNKLTLRPGSARVLETATAAASLIAQFDGRVRVGALARQLDLTPRTLLRHFEEAVGLPVQSQARIVRFLATRAHIDRHVDASWSEIAYRFGYVDQSHLVRDFRRYYGEPPSVFRARQHEARLITLVARLPEQSSDEPAESHDS
jgi:AraC-like DNA-binding protein